MSFVLIVIDRPLDDSCIQFAINASECPTYGTIIEEFLARYNYFRNLKNWEILHGDDAISKDQPCADILKNCTERKQPLKLVLAESITLEESKTAEAERVAWMKSKMFDPYAALIKTVGAELEATTTIKVLLSDAEELNVLRAVGMGFPKEVARTCIRNAHNDLARAIELMLEQLARGQ